MGRSQSWPTSCAELRNSQQFGHQAFCLHYLYREKPPSLKVLDSPIERLAHRGTSTSKQGPFLNTRNLGQPMAAGATHIQAVMPRYREKEAGSSQKAWPSVLPPTAVKSHLCPGLLPEILVPRESPRTNVASFLSLTRHCPFSSKISRGMEFLSWLSG